MWKKIDNWFLSPKSTATLMILNCALAGACMENEGWWAVFCLALAIAQANKLVSECTVFIKKAILAVLHNEIETLHKRTCEMNDMNWRRTETLVKTEMLKLKEE